MAVPADAPISLAPAHAAEHFQVQRHGTRYYCDPLPADSIWPTWDGVVPGFSSLKPSKPFRKSVTVDDTKYTVPLDWHRAGEFIAEHGLDDRHAFYTSANVQRDRDFARGHAIHAVAEAVLDGTPVPGWAERNIDAAPYLEHLRRWIEANVAEAIAIEGVVLSRTHGYGGTGDLWCRLTGGDSVYLDYKSRGDGSSHAIHEEEIAQGGAYTGADYMIAPDRNGGACRVPIPQTTLGVVLSLRPDGVQAYAYDIITARQGFLVMVDAYRSTSEFGKIARKAKIAKPTCFAQIDGVSGAEFRQHRLADEGAPTPSSAPSTVVESPGPNPIETALSANEGTANPGGSTPNVVDADPMASDAEGATDPATVAPSSELTPAQQQASLPANPDEGPPADPAAVAALRKRYLALPKPARAVVGAFATQAQQALVPYFLTGDQGRHTVRRFELVRALTIAAEADSANDEAIRSLLALTLGDCAMFPAVTVGHAIGALDAKGAAEFAVNVEVFIAGGFHWVAPGRLERAA